MLLGTSLVHRNDCADDEVSKSCVVDRGLLLDIQEALHNILEEASVAELASR